MYEILKEGIMGNIDMKFYERTSDGGNGNHSVSLPIILIKMKSIKCFHLHK